jgi:hypothetical protein
VFSLHIVSLIIRFEPNMRRREGLKSGCNKTTQWSGSCFKRLSSAAKCDGCRVSLPSRCRIRIRPAAFEPCCYAMTPPVQGARAGAELCRFWQQVLMGTNTPSAQSHRQTADSQQLLFISDSTPGAERHIPMGGLRLLAVFSFLYILNRKNHLNIVIYSIFKLLSSLTF